MIYLFLNLGGGEILVVLLVVLLFFGSKSIPELARGLGKGLREIREATDNIKREIEKGASDINETSNPSTQKEIHEIIEQNKKAVPLDQSTE